MCLKRCRHFSSLSVKIKYVEVLRFCSDRILVRHFQISSWIDCFICSLANRFLSLRLCYNDGQWWIIESTVSDVSSHEVSSLKTCYALMWHTIIIPSLLLAIGQAVRSFDQVYVPFLATASSCFFLFVTNVTHKVRPFFCIEENMRIPNTDRESAGGGSRGPYPTFCAK